MIGAHWETDAATGWMHRSDEDITEHTLTSVLRVLSPFAAYSSDVELIIMSIVPPGLPFCRRDRRSGRLRFARCAGTERKQVEEPWTAPPRASALPVLDRTTPHSSPSRASDPGLSDYVVEAVDWWPDGIRPMITADPQTLTQSAQERGIDT
jgi:hypothetical protein